MTIGDRDNETGRERHRGGMKIKILLAALSFVLIGVVFYFCYPKYEIYQGDGLLAQDGIITYRFNKITGAIECLDYNTPKDGDLKSIAVLKWRNRKPLGFIKKP